MLIVWLSVRQYWRHRFISRTCEAVSSVLRRFCLSTASVSAVVSCRPAVDCRALRRVCVGLRRQPPLFLPVSPRAGLTGLPRWP